MRLLEQLERAPCGAIAQSADADTSSEGCSRVELDSAPLQSPGSESSSKQTASQQEFAGAYSDSPRGNAREDGSSSAGCENPKQVPGSVCQKHSCDIAAMAALTVQIFTRQLQLQACSGHRLLAQPTTPSASCHQHFVLACFAERPASMQKLLRDSFFTAEVRAAAGYLARLDATVSNQRQAAENHEQPSRPGEQLQTVFGRACTLHAMLDGPTGPEGAGKARRAAVVHAEDCQGCSRRGEGRKPLSRSCFRRAADCSSTTKPGRPGCPSPVEPHHAVVQEPGHPEPSTGVGSALRRPGPSWFACQPGQGVVQAEVRTQLMQATRLRQVVAVVGLSAYVDILHSALLFAVCGGTSNTGEPAAAQLTQHAIQVCTILLEQDL